MRFFCLLLILATVATGVDCFVVLPVTKSLECTSTTSTTGSRCAPLWLAAAANTKKKKKKKQQQSNNNKKSGGFGGSSAKNKKTKSWGGGAGGAAVDDDFTTLSPRAKELLEKHGDDVDLASNDYYQSLIKDREREEGQEEEEEGATTVDDTTTIVTSPEEERRRAVRVAATWDTVALFLPRDYAINKGKAPAYVDRRLKHIAYACLMSRGDVVSDDNNAAEGGRRCIEFLDVGCGDGAIIPYLPTTTTTTENNKGKTTTRADSSGSHDDDEGARVRVHYLGLDVSSEMIRLGRLRHPGHDMRVGSFPESVCGTSTTTVKNDDDPAIGDHDDQREEQQRRQRLFFDVIFFNGSLQFFSDTSKVLEQAAARLKPGGRIVISHAHGGKFVQTECRNNPGIAVRAMPTQDDLERIVTTTMSLPGTNLSLVPRSELLDPSTRRDPTDYDDQKFYLAAFQKQPRRI